MKTSFTKVAALLIAAATAFPLIGGEVVIKPSRYSPPPKSVFETPVTPPAKVASCCKEKFVSVTTQDSKLKTKTITASKHTCPTCKTTIKSVGAQKAGRKDVVEHSCAGKVTTVAVCCEGMPPMN